MEVQRDSKRFLRQRFKLCCVFSLNIAGFQERKVNFPPTDSRTKCKLWINFVSSFSCCKMFLKIHSTLTSTTTTSSMTGFHHIKHKLASGRLTLKFLLLMARSTIQVNSSASRGEIESKLFLFCPGDVNWVSLRNEIIFLLLAVTLFIILDGKQWICRADEFLFHVVLFTISFETRKHFRAVHLGERSLVLWRMNSTTENNLRKDFDPSSRS